eukprot:scaffold155351_cov31-Tisochrysis_lutea.AAC.1
MRRASIDPLGRSHLQRIHQWWRAENWRGIDVARMPSTMHECLQVRPMLLSRRHARRRCKAQLDAEGRAREMAEPPAQHMRVRSQGARRRKQSSKPQPPVSHMLSPKAWPCAQ